MAAIRLDPCETPKPWGRRDLAPWSAATPAVPIGEIVYTSGDDAPLLVKALFTAERLSVQVHPDAAAAAALGLPRGKDEAWVILAAEPGAMIGLGLTEALDAAGLAAAARDGSIARRLAWYPAHPGDVFFAAAGTIHAIGAGLTLIEVQQNLDLTWRLYDYGRDRELHVEAAVEAAHAGPWRPAPRARPLGGGRWSLVEGPSFVLERWAGNGAMRLAPPPGRPVWVTVIGGGGTAGGMVFAAGEVWLAREPGNWHCAPGTQLLLAYPGAGIASGAWTDA